MTVIYTDIRPYAYAALPCTTETLYIYTGKIRRDVIGLTMLISFPFVAPRWRLESDRVLGACDNRIECGRAAVLSKRA